MDLVEPIVELYRRMSCELPADVTRALERARDVEEKGSTARDALETILEDVRLAREHQRPLCQDTGLPVFYVARPTGVREREVVEAILAATREATRRSFLRPNAVDPLTGANSGDNVGVGFPIIHHHETDGDALVSEAMLKGGGCENAGVRYKLPDGSLDAPRDLEGVRRCVLDAVVRAQGRACPPCILGIALGGARDATAALAKQQLMRPLDASSSPLPPGEGRVRGQGEKAEGRRPKAEGTVRDASSSAVPGAWSLEPEASNAREHGEEFAVSPVIADLEQRLLAEINELGIGPAGLGGKSTALGVKIATQHRHCACYFVEVAFGCWAMRRGRVTIGGGGATHA
jgi:fumarate hydratase class I